MISAENFLPIIVPAVATNSVDLQKDDITFICSDGISDWLENAELVKIFTTEELTFACNLIFDLVKERCPKNWLDDMTIIAFKI